MGKNGTVLSEYQMTTNSAFDWKQQANMQKKMEKQLSKMTYQDKVAKCILEIQNCEKNLNKKLSELNKLLKEGSVSTLQNSYPHQSFINGY